MYIEIERNNNLLLTGGQTTMKEQNQFTKAQEKQLRFWFADKMNCRWQDVILAQSSQDSEEYAYFNFIDVGAYNENDEQMVTLRVAQYKDDRRKKLQLMEH
jgi:hypothetical protein